MDLQKSARSSNYLTAILQCMAEQNEPELDELKIALDTVEYRSGKSVYDFLGFGEIKPNKKIQMHRDEYFDDCYTYGEFVNIVRNGRSIQSLNSGYVLFTSYSILLARLNKGQSCPGNFIEIFGEGHFWMGEFYKSGFFNNKLRKKYQSYCEDGRIEDFEQ